MKEETTASRETMIWKAFLLVLFCFGVCIFFICVMTKVSSTACRGEAI